MYILDTSWGFGVFKNGFMVFEAETEDECYAYMVAEREKERRYCANEN